MDISNETILSTRKKMLAHQVRATHIVEACLENIKKYNTQSNVLLSVRDQKTLFAEAKAIDIEGYDKPLAGIPIVLKDMFTTDGIETTAASKVLKGYVPSYDATVVKKLKQAGAIIMGKANQDAWAHGTSGENSDFGSTANAYNLDHVAGGSSSGSAVSVALGMSFMAMGTDTGGSIRVPAAYNNLVGLKPTYGRVSRYGVVAMASSLDSIGHITKTVEDSAYVLGITAGVDRYDATTGDQRVPDYMKRLKEKDLHGVRIGVSKEYITIGSKVTKGMHTGLEEKTEQALSLLQKLGATIVDISLPYTQAALETYYIIVPSEVSSNLARYDGIRYGNTRTVFGPEAKRRIMIGTYTLSSGYYDAYYKTAQKVRTLVCNDFSKAFESVDVIFAPVTPSPAPRTGELVNDPLALYLSDIYTVPINLAGLAALALPAGFIGSLPIGIQLIGPQWSEDRLFSIGSVFERAMKPLINKRE